MKRDPNDLCCNDCGVYPCDCPRVRVPRRPGARVETTWDQDVWWTTLDGIVHLIDDLTDTHRVNIAAFMVRNAEGTYAVKRENEEVGSWWSFVAAGEDADWGPVMDDPPDRASVLALVVPEVEAGKHLEWVRGTKLFRRMIRGLEGQLRPGTLPADEQKLVFAAGDMAEVDF